MKICIIGGIFDKDAAYRATVLHTPETVLFHGLVDRGHDVEARGHSSTGDLTPFDVVHVHHLGAAALLGANDPGRAPLAFTSHGFPQVSFPRRSALRYVIRRSDAVIALSETEAAWQRRQSHVLGRQHVIPNGIDNQVFRYVPPRAHRGDTWHLLYIGQLVPFKGLDYLLEALARLRERYELELSLAYHVDTQLSALQARASELDVHGLAFLGRRSPSELARLIAAADMLVLPSLRESLPSVISEAMMVGRPVVATDVGAIREQVQSFGVVVAPKDSNSLAQAIAQVIDRYPRYAAMSEAVSAAAGRRFGIDAMVTRHERLYTSLYKSPPRRRLRRYVPGRWATTPMIARSEHARCDPRLDPSGP